MARSPATRARKALKPSETAIHMQVAGFLRRAWPDDLMWWHTPNGGKRDFRLKTKRDGTVVRFSPEAQKLQAMGVLPGIPDLLFTLPNAQLAGIELKDDEGTLSDDQIKVRDKMLALKCGWAEARSLEEVETILSGWLALFGRKLKATTVRRAA